MIKYILPPVLGAIIGYITNDLAIRMLFHPYKEIYIGKWHVPFTPGLIPAQKNRLAKSLGDVVSGQLLSAQVLMKEALSQRALNKVRAGTLAFLDRMTEEKATLRELLLERMPPDRLDRYVDRVRVSGGVYLMDKLVQAEIGRSIARSVTDEARVKLQGLHALEGLFKLIGVNEILQSLENAITGIVDRQIEDKGPELVSGQMEAISAELLDNPVCELIGPYKDRFPRIVDKVVTLYEGIVRDHLETMVRTAKIDRIVQRRIDSLDAAQIEEAAFGVMRRELKAIVYLGAVLGFIMGFINLLFL